MRNKTDLAESPRSNLISAMSQVNGGRQTPQLAGSVSAFGNAIQSQQTHYMQQQYQQKNMQTMPHFKGAQSIDRRQFKDLENSIRGMTIFR